MKQIKNKIWLWFIRNQPEGCILPKKLLIIKFLLFPFDFLYHVLAKNRGYQWNSDLWIISGIKFSETSIRHVLTSENGAIFKINVCDDVLIFTKIEKG